MKTRINQFVVIVQTTIVLLINYFAAAGFINGTSPSEISDRYPTVLTPSGYAFAIWSVIYLGMIAFSVYQALPGQSGNRMLRRVRVLYIVLCSANIGWIFAWHYEFIVVSMLLMLILLVLLGVISVVLTEAESTLEKVAVRLPFSIYFGWITLASLLNALVMLNYLGLTLTGVTGAIIGVILVILTVAIGVLVRFKLDTMAYPITIAWGLTAIGVGQSGKTAVVLATAIGMMALIFVALWGYVKDR